MDTDSIIIAYSMPGTREFFVATVAEVGLSHTDMDFVFAPYEKSAHPSYFFKFSSVAANRVFSCHSDKSSASYISSTKTHYTKAFKIIKNAIANGSIEKAVLSRIKKIEVDTADLYDTYITIKNKYVDAFTYLVHLPGVTTWIGASPELLLSQSGMKMHTTAVAGTQMAPADLAQVKWGTKEIHEHAVIEEFLADQLGEAEIKHVISQSYTILAGPVAHIRSDIEMHVEDRAKTIDLIHPGPALSGRPVKEAMKIIADVEADDRKYYCGYVGPLSNNSCALYVNIRSMEVYENGYHLYVGGGITADSDLEAEWEETELKAETLGSLIKYDYSA